ncbi:MAG: pirin family protein [Thermoplasmatota archaeon]
MPVSVTHVFSAIQTPEGDGMLVNRAFPSQALGRLDPFLVFDEMGPIDFAPGSRAGFPDHPHRGFETVTYVLDGAVEHQDSNGNKGRIGPGDVQWMTAGSGVVHSEMPAADLRKAGGRMHGFQLWVNLPRADKMMAPRYQEIKSGQIPEEPVPGGKVRILAGRFGRKGAAIATRTPIQYLHAVLEPGAAISLPVPEGHQGFAYATKGSGKVAGTRVPTGSYATLAGAGGLDVEAGTEGIELLLITGVPLGEPVFQYGPFVMTTRDEILQAIEDYYSGRFGAIPATT